MRAWNMRTTSRTRIWSYGAGDGDGDWFEEWRLLTEKFRSEWNTQHGDSTRAQWERQSVQIMQTMRG
jgi:hypothetical protein